MAVVLGRQSSGRCRSPEEGPDYNQANTAWTCSRFKMVWGQYKIKLIFKSIQQIERSSRKTFVMARRTPTPVRRLGGQVERRWKLVKNKTWHHMIFPNKRGDIPISLLINWVQKLEVGQGGATTVHSPHAPSWTPRLATQWTLVRWTRLFTTCWYIYTKRYISPGGFFAPQKGHRWALFQTGLV